RPGPRRVEAGSALIVVTYTSPPPLALTLQSRAGSGRGSTVGGGAGRERWRHRGRSERPAPPPSRGRHVSAPPRLDRVPTGRARRSPRSQSGTPVALPPGRPHRVVPRSGLLPAGDHPCGR